MNRWALALCVTAFQFSDLSPATAAGFLDSLEKKLFELDKSIKGGGDNEQQPQQPSKPAPTASQPPAVTTAPSAGAQPASDPLTAETQRLLTALGYDIGPIDGLFGRKTGDAIRNFERSLGIPETGRVSQPLVQQMRQAVASGTFSPAGSNALAQQPQPSQRELTATAQGLLNDLGYGVGPADGVAGAKTRNAVADYQQRNGMRPDGRITSELVARLRTSASGAAPAAPLAQNAAPASSPATQTGAIEGLVEHPGIRPLRLAYHNSKLIDFKYVPNDSGKYSNQRSISTDTTRLLELAALSQMPNAFDDDPLYYANRHLMREEASKYLAGRPSESTTVRQSRWKGQNEFDVADNRNAFIRDYGNVFKSFAINTPIRIQKMFMMRVGQYDAAKGGFQLGRIRGYGNGRFLPGGSVPPGMIKEFLEMDTSQARGLAQLLDDRAKERGDLMTGDRTLFLVLDAEILRVTSSDGRSVSVESKIQSATYYTDIFLTDVFMRIDAAADTAFASSGQIQDLTSPSPHPWNEEWQILRFIENHAEAAAGFNLLPQYAELRLRIDAKTRNNGLQGLAESDPRTPFFPAHARQARPEDLPKFKTFVDAYIKSLPSSVVITTRHVSSRTDQLGNWVFRNFSVFSKERLSVEVMKLLDQRGIDHDQVLVFDNGRNELYKIPTFIVLPNQARFYEVKIPEAQAKGMSSSTFRTTFEFVKSEFDSVRVNGAEQAFILQYMKPVITEIQPYDRNGNAAWTEFQRFDGIPPLNGALFDTAASMPGSTPAPPVASAPPQEAIMLDRPMIELLAVARRSDDLTDTQIAERLLPNRWTYEDKIPLPPTGRFFRLGSPQPDANAYKGMVSDFRKWARDNAPSADQVYHIRSWQYADGNSEIGAPRFQKGSKCLVSRLERLQLGGCGDPKILNRYPGLADACASMEKIADSDPAPYYGIFDHGYPVLSHRKSFCQQYNTPAKAVSYTVEIPQILPEMTADDPALKYAQLGDRIIEAKVGDVLITYQIPSVSADAPELWKAFMSQYVGSKKPVTDSDLPKILVKTNASNVYFYDTKGQLVKAAAPTRETNYRKIIEGYEKTLTLAHQNEVSRLDIVGLSLGMSFDEAEKIIREHMSVDRTFVLNRDNLGPDVFARGFPEYTSAKIFFREDGREAIAIYDEAPAAPGTVLAAWRKVFFDRGQLSRDAVVASFTDKYGEPTAQNFGSKWVISEQKDLPSAHLVFTAGSADSLCNPNGDERSLNTYNMNEVWRTEKGERSDWTPSFSWMDFPKDKGGTDAVFVLGMNSIARYDDGNGISRFNCRPRIDAHFSPEWNGDAFVLFLSDQPTYLEHLLESKKLFEEKPKASVEPKAKIKL